MEDETRFVLCVLCCYSFPAFFHPTSSEIEVIKKFIQNLEKCSTDSLSADVLNTRGISLCEQCLSEVSFAVEQNEEIAKIRAQVRIIQSQFLDARKQFKKAMDGYTSKVRKLQEKINCNDDSLLMTALVKEKCKGDDTGTMCEETILIDAMNEFLVLKRFRDDVSSKFKVQKDDTISRCRKLLNGYKFEKCSSSPKPPSRLPQLDNSAELPIPSTIVSLPVAPPKDISLPTVPQELPVQIPMPKPAFLLPNANPVEVFLSTLQQDPPAESPTPITAVILPSTNPKDVLPCTTQQGPSPQLPLPPSQDLLPDKVPVPKISSEIQLKHIRSETHFQTQQKTPSAYNCQSCLINFSTSTSLINHRREAHGYGEEKRKAAVKWAQAFSPCCYCGNLIKQISYRSHKLCCSNRPQPPWLCDKCGEFCRTMDVLDNHFLYNCVAKCGIMPPVSLNCDTCSEEGFETEFHLRRHKQICGTRITAII